MPPDTARQLLAAARKLMVAADIDNSALDTRLLLQQATGLSHAELVADPDRTVGAAEAAAFRALMARRLAHEPVSRIRGRRDFYGREFLVTPDVLDPRPDTETLIEAALPLIDGPARLLDLGAGSGAIVVTLLAERPAASGTAVDISPAALAVTRANAERLGVADRLQLIQGSWFAAVAGRFDLIVSNPPYIPAGEIAGLEAEVRAFDPLLALAGGGDGLDCYRVIAAGAKGRLAPGGAILLEIGAGQAADVTAILAAAGLAPVAQYRDLGQHVRVLHFAES
jgi:release factor glutamine methyltransferase